MVELNTTIPVKVKLIDLPSAVEELGSAPAGVRTLSVYVDTSPARVSRQAYLLSFRDRCQSLRPTIVAEDSDAFEVARARIEYYLVNQLEPRSRGMALFAASGADDIVVVPMPAAPAEQVVWSDRPSMAPLEATLDEHERLAVALFDADRTRLFTVFLGAIESQQQFVDFVPAKQGSGGSFGPGQTRFARHREDHLRRHAVRTARALMVLLRTHAFDRLILAGPDEALAVLRRELPRPLQARLEGTVALSLFATDAQVLEAAGRAGESIERRTEERLVDELLEAAGASHVALGLVGTLNALADGRVHVLLIAEQFDARGTTCPTCTRLVPDEHFCPACGVEGRPLVSLQEAILERALAQGARVELVSGRAAARLDEHGGIGAWTRF